VFNLDARFYSSTRELTCVSISGLVILIVIKHNCLYVEEKKRGVGAGKSLIEVIRDEATERSWAKVYWITRESNPARALYDRLAVLEDFVRYTINV
jgi:GNAT superfamily N-acetyltransferase